ncbi:Ig-like domain-containing protein [Cellulomonas sp. P22]|uniref:Ig-like domain-containing protein n=1 Tax=Cellulomonas sp. P22 TaxID=3373189 RepID=UPI00378A9555
MTPRSLRRRTTQVAALVTAPVVLAVLAIINPGFPLAQVDLNDSGVWLTATQSLRLGRLNAQVEELNAGLVTAGAQFDVLQDAADVLLVEPGTISVVDPASVTLTTQLPVPTGTEVAMAAGTVALVDPSGHAWVRPIAQLGSLRPATDPADLELGVGGHVVVTDEGVAYGVAGETGDVTRVALVDGVAEPEAAGTLGGRVATLTAVGDEPVGLDGSTLRTRRAAVTLTGSGLVLQQPGPHDDTVLVASTSALLEVPLGGGDAQSHPTTGSGAPAAPVRLDGCAHGAWASAGGSYLRLCGDDPVQVLDLEGMSTTDQLRFRVNRGVVVLNDTLRGRLWMPLEDTALREPNWEDIVPEDEPEESEEDSEAATTTQDVLAECGTESSPPVAGDDEFGVRAGRTTILPVIDNDTSSDCGILAVSEHDALPEDFGVVEPVYGGRALQVRVAEGATGSVAFTYTISDGRGTSTPSTATVQLTVRDAATNEPPRQARVGSMRVEQGAQADHAVLADFTDPDGDDLVLVGARADSGTVRFRQDGTLTYVADGGSLGRTQVHVTVSDGTETTEGLLDVDVRAAGSLAPQIDPVHAVTHVDQDVLLSPLDAVRTTGREPARLAGVDDLAGATITTDLTAGTFTFRAARPGTYYVTFVVAAPPQQATGLARIDVLEWPAQVQPPVAVRDRVYLAPGREVTAAPLANDTDPAGGVLVLQTVDVPAESGLRVAILNHELVQISATRTLEAPVMLRYTVSNGSASSVGEIAVHPVPASATSQPPVVENLEVSVRTGGVVTVPVLDHAYDPDGDALTLVTELAEGLGDGQGLLFVSGDVLRYQAPSEPLTARATFVVRDQTGNETAATLTVRVHASDATAKAPPRPRDLTARVFEGDTIRITVPLVGIDDDGDGVTLLGVAGAPTKGRVVDSGADWLEYEALPGETGTDEFTYAVEDWTGQRTVATIRVGISPRPTSSTQVVARNDEVTLRPGQRVEVRVLANDIDASGGELSLDEALEMTSDTGDEVDAHVEGRRVIVQAPSAPAVLQIAYTVTNGRGGRDSAVLTVTVREDAPVLPPVARDVVVPAIDTLGRESVEVDVLAVAQNPSGPLSDLEVSVPASAASVATVTPAGRVVITLVDHAQTVPYLLTNTTVTGGGVSTYAFITVPALGFFPPTPRPKAPELRVASGEQLVIPLDEQVQVAPGRTATVADPTAVQATKSDGSALVKDATTLVFTSAAGYAGPASITVPVTDRTGVDDLTGRTSVITLPVTVYAVDDYPPTFVATPLAVAPGELPFGVDLRAFTQGPEGATGAADLYTYQLASAVPAGFTVTLEGTMLRVAAARTTSKGTRAMLDLTLGYGREGSMPVQVELRVTASNRAVAQVLDREIPDGVQGRDTVVDALAGARNPFPDTPLTIVDVTVETPGAGTAGASGGGNVTVRPAPDFVGSMVTRFRVRDATGDPDRQVEGRITVKVRGKPATPRAPRVVEVRDRTVVLSWDAPDNRGETITGYRVTASPGNVVRACASTTCTIDNLTNDVEYTFTVAAQNAVDWSEPSPSSATARPDAVPDQPDAPALAFGDGQLTATWAAPASSGSAVTRYDVMISPAPAAGSATQTTSTPSATFRGLQNGTAYTVQVRAYNKLPDPGAWSRPSQPMSPAGVPGAPVPTATRSLTGWFGNGRIDVTWDAPAANGDAISGYEVSVDGGAPVSNGTATSYVIADAERGKTYEVRVRAINKAGPSIWGLTVGETWSAPGVPTNLQATASTRSAWGEGTITVQWNAPTDAGGTSVSVRDYEIEGYGTTTDRRKTLEGFTGGDTPTLRIRAWNSHDVAGEWVTFPVVTVVTAPQAPTVRVTTAGFEQVDVAVTENADGGSPVLEREYRVNGARQSTPPTGLYTQSGGGQVAVTVRVRNSAGWSAEGSASAATGAGAVPTAEKPTATSPRAEVLELLWAAATSPGQTVTGYEWQVVRGTTVVANGSAAAVPASPVTTNVPGGGTVHVQVRAKNATGWSAWVSSDDVIVPVASG